MIVLIVVVFAFPWTAAFFRCFGIVFDDYFGAFPWMVAEAEDWFSGFSVAGPSLRGQVCMPGPSALAYQAQHSQSSRYQKTIKRQKNIFV